MRTLPLMALFVLLGLSTYAQTPPPAPAAPAPAPRALIETAAMAEKTVKGAPFSAQEMNESVQVLADGNRIVRSSTNQLYRNSEGRFRREISGGSGGALGTFYSFGPGITILDPVGGYRYLLDSKLMTARVDALRSARVAAAKTSVVPSALAAEKLQAAEADRMKLEHKRAVELAGSLPTAVVPVNAPRIEETTKILSPTIAPGYSGTFVYGPLKRSKYETRTDDLGTQVVEGVEAVGTRTVTTIPAGDIGNERPIEIVYEKWYSNELQMVVMSRHSDPRYGEQSYRLTNVVRSEPDPSLFEVPPGYKMLSDRGGAYVISTPKGSAGQGVMVTRSSGTGTSTSVRSPKP